MSDKKNKGVRILSIIMIVLIAADFIGMLVSLFTGNMNFFFYEGGVLVLLIVISLAVVKIGRKRSEAETKQEISEK